MIALGTEVILDLIVTSASNFVQGVPIGSVVSATVANVSGASGALGYKVGDRIMIPNPDTGDLDDATYATVTEVFGPKGQVVKIGTSTGATLLMLSILVKVFLVEHMMPMDMIHRFYLVNLFALLIVMVPLWKPLLPLWHR